MRAIPFFVAATVLALAIPAGARVIPFQTAPIFPGSGSDDGNGDQNCFGSATYNAKGYGPRDLSTSWGSPAAFVIHHCGGNHPPIFTPPDTGHGEGTDGGDDHGSNDPVIPVVDPKPPVILPDTSETDTPHNGGDENIVTAPPPSENVPEPASLALLAGGLMLAGTALRRRIR